MNRVMCEEISPLLRPSNLFAVLTLMQFAVWLMVDPELLSVPGLAPKYVSGVALTRYTIMVALFYLVLRLSEGTRVLRLCEKEPRSNAAVCSGVWLLTILYFAAMAAMLFPVISNLPSFISKAFVFGTMASASQLLEDTSSGFLSNLAPLLISFHSYYYFSCKESRRNRHLFALLLLITCAFLEGLLYSRRLQFLICILSIVITWLIVCRVRIPIKLFVTGAVSVFCVIVAFELTRWGMQNATRLNIAVLSPQNIVMTAQYNLAAYFYSDINNAFVILGNQPEYCLIFGGIPQIQEAIYSFFDLDSSSFAYLSEWKSSYGTVTVFGLWWLSAGWLSIAYIAIVAVAVGSVWRSVTQGSAQNVFGYTMLVLMLLGLINNLRINYFFTTKFIVPLLGYAFVAFFSKRRYENGRISKGAGLMNGALATQKKELQ